MRWVIGAVVAIALAPSAFAADLDSWIGAQPVGPATFTRWSGFYFGGQGGYSDVNADFSQATQAPIAYTLRNSTLEIDSEPSQMPVLGSGDHSGIAYGAFAGYNTQWQDLILGIEGNYNHTSLTVNAPSAPIARSGFSDGQGNTYTVAITANGKLSNLDYGTLRARAGYVLENFLPYGFVGFTMGRADVHVSATAVGTCDPGSTPSCGPFAFTSLSGMNGDLLYGFTVGGGLDYAVTQNIFLRAEFEYIRFAQTLSIPIAITSAHFGAGFKF